MRREEGKIFRSRGLKVSRLNLCLFLMNRKRQGYLKKKEEKKIAARHHNTTSTTTTATFSTFFPDVLHLFFPLTVKYFWMNNGFRRRCKLRLCVLFSVFRFQSCIGCFCSRSVHVFSLRNPDDEKL